MLPDKRHVLVHRNKHVNIQSIFLQAEQELLQDLERKQ